MTSSDQESDDWDQSEVDDLIESKEDIQRIMSHLRKREKMLKALQEKIKARESKLDEAEEDLKRREAKLSEDREEISRIKQSLGKIGADLVALSEKSDSIIDDVRYDEEIVEDIFADQVPEDKKPGVESQKPIPKKEIVEPPKPKRAFGRKPRVGKKKEPPKQKKSLRQTLKEKRDRLKGATLDESEFGSLEQEETFACPVCGMEVSTRDEVCAGCGAELNWDS